MHERSVYIYFQGVEKFSTDAQLSVTRDNPRTVAIFRRTSGESFNNGVSRSGTPVQQRGSRLQTTMRASDTDITLLDTRIHVGGISCVNCTVLSWYTLMTLAGSCQKRVSLPGSRLVSLAHLFSLYRLESQRHKGNSSRKLTKMRYPISRYEKKPVPSSN